MSHLIPGFRAVKETLIKPETKIDSLWVAEGKNSAGIKEILSMAARRKIPIYHKKIFDEYFQVPGSKIGTGIGLYSVKKLVENHKGIITISSSSLNKETCFEILFPCCPGEFNDG